MERDMTGKTVVITGASSGIGAVAARKLAALGATVLPVGRSKTATAAIATEVGAQPLIYDYARLGDVRALAEHLLDQCPTIDVLVHNAGLIAHEYAVTEDGHEFTWQVNYLAPFLLQHLLHERLSASGAHVVVTSSVAHRFGRIRLDNVGQQRGRYRSFAVYADTKLADLLFAREIARRTPQTGITAVAFHPGGVRSGFGRDSKTTAMERLGWRLASLSMIDSDAGAEPLVQLATVADPRSVNGQYYNRLKADAATAKQARDSELGQQLWQRTETLLELPAAH